jgi:hypothetical protein
MCMGFEVLAAVATEITTFCDVTKQSDRNLNMF